MNIYLALAQQRKGRFFVASVLLLTSVLLALSGTRTAVATSMAAPPELVESRVIRGPIGGPGEIPEEILREIENGEVVIEGGGPVPTQPPMRMRMEMRAKGGQTDQDMDPGEHEQPRVNSPVYLETKEIKATIAQGFKGFHKQGASWLPVTVLLENRGATSKFNVEIANEADGTSRTQKEVFLDASATKLLRFHIFYGMEAPLTLRIRKNNRVVAWSPVQIANIWDGELIGVLSENDDAMPLQAITKGKNDIIIKLENVDIPDYASELDSLETLIVSNADTSYLSEKQSKAITDWVSSGGTLLVFGGAGWKETVEGLDKSLLPVKPEGIISADFSLQELTGKDKTYKAAALTKAGLTEGEVLGESGDNVLVASKAFGGGKVHWIGFDPQVVSKETDIYEKLMERKPSIGRSMNFIPQESFFQINEAFRFLSGKIISSRWFIIFSGIYLVVLGPLNYYFLKKKKRKEFTWVTVPVIALTFTLLPYAYSHAQKGSALKVNQVNMAFLDVQNDDGIKVSGFASLFSPAESSYEISLSSNMLLALMNLGFGPMGMGGQITSHSLMEGSERNSLSGVRVGYGSSKQIFFDGYQKLDIASKLDIDLKLDQGGVLAGRISNKSKYELEDVLLWLDSKAYEVERLKPGQTENITLAGWKARRIGNPADSSMRGRSEQGKNTREVVANMLLRQPADPQRGASPRFMAWIKNADGLRVRIKGFPAKGFNETIIVKNLDLDSINDGLKKGAFKTPVKMLKGWSSCSTHKNVSYDFPHPLDAGEELSLTFAIPPKIRDFVTGRETINYALDLNAGIDTRISVLDPASGSWIAFPVKKTMGNDKISLAGKPSLIGREGLIKIKLIPAAVRDEPVVVRSLELSDG